MVSGDCFDELLQGPFPCRVSGPVVENDALGADFGDGEDVEHARHRLHCHQAITQKGS